MKSLPAVLTTTLRLTVAVVIAMSVSAPVRAQAAADPSAEQLGMHWNIGCGGATDGSTPHCYTFAVMDADGTHGIRLPVPGTRPRWSPDGRAIAATVNFGNEEVIVTALVGGSEVNITNHPATDRTPAWSPDGTTIAFASDRDGPLDLYLMSPDGSGLARIVTGTGAAWAPSWSPDGTRLAFTCADAPDWPADICAIGRDGTGFARLTFDPAPDFDPAWSPSGNTILFASERFAAGAPELVLIDASSGGLPIRLIPGTVAYSPSWSSNGSRIAFDAFWGSVEDGDQPFWYIQVANADGTGATVVADGHSPAWRPGSTVVTERPVASFTVTCTDLTCTFDGSGSSDADGTVAAYGWQFGDGTGAAGVTATHTFAPGRNYAVSLVVMDDQGALGTTGRAVELNQPPVAEFTSNCSALTCSFDASASTDPDDQIYYYLWQFGDGGEGTGRQTTHTYPAGGTYQVTLRVYDAEWVYGQSTQTVTIVNAPPVASFTFACTSVTCMFDGSGSSDDAAILTYAWAFGDGTTASGKTSTRTYAGSGSYNVTLTVTDAARASDAVTQLVTVVQPEVHVGDLDGQTSAIASTWTATMTVRVHDKEHRGGVANVYGSWSTGETTTCTTDAGGSCIMSRSSIPKKTTSVTFTIGGVVLSGASSVYRPLLNHDPDGDSNGSTITLKRP